MKVRRGMEWRAVTGSRRRRHWALCVALAALCAVPASTAAQDVQVQEREECRCVDRNGNEIENCRCLRAPRMGLDPFVWAQTMVEGAPRARIGVWIESDQGGEAESAGGARLSEIQEDGPADRAGLQAGDIVLAVNGILVSAPLADADEEGDLDPQASLPVQRFVHLVGQLEPEEPAELVVLRDGERRRLTVTPEAPSGPSLFFQRGGDAPVVMGRMWDPEEERVLDDEVRREMEQAREEMERAAQELEQLRVRVAPRVFEFRGRGPERGFRIWTDSVDGQSGLAFLGGDPCLTLESRQGRRMYLFGQENCVEGVELVELNPDLAEYFDAPAEGVLITEVSPDSSLGLRTGDVLLAVDGRQVEDASDVRRVLRSYEPDEEIRLRVIRDGREMEVLGRRRPE